MLITWSPLTVTGLKVETSSEPRTTDPTGALGMITTVMRPVAPGASVSGVYGAVAFTVCCQTSPELEVTAPSKTRVSATTARLAVAAGAAPWNGPSSSGSATHEPGATCGAASVAIAKLPGSDVPSRRGPPKPAWMDMSIGFEPWAATMMRSVPGGTTKLGITAPRGSGTLVAPLASSGVTWTWFRRGSTKKSFVATPVLVTRMAAVTG